MDIMEKEKLWIIQQLLQTDDEAMLLTIQQFLGGGEMSNNPLTHEQRTEVLEARRQHFAGETKSYTRDEVKDLIRNKHKQGVLAG